MRRPGGASHPQLENQQHPLVSRLPHANDFVGSGRLIGAGLGGA